MRTFLQPVGFLDMLLFILKSVLFGFIASKPPIFTGLKLYERTLNAVPVSVLNGMIRIFLLIITVEVLLLALRLI